MNVLRLSSVSALAAASLAAVPLSASAAQEASALTRIEAAFQEGRIDAPTRALYGLYLMKDHSRLPAELRPTDSEEPLRCGTFLWKRALNELESMDEGQRASYATMGQRPTGIVGTVTAVTNEVRVHYLNAADAALANSVALYADESWTMEVDTMGWRAPVLDPGTEGSTDLDLYIADTGFGGAYCAPEFTGPGPSDDYSTFIVLDPTIPANVMNSYVAHEFNHSLQFAYSASEADWLYESTATYMEDEVYDGINDYLYFVNDFMSKPERTFSYATYSDTYMYGGAVFHHFLSEVYASGSTTASRDLWDIAETGGTDFFEAAEQVTGKSFEELYAEFAGYRWLAGTNSDGWSDEASLWLRTPKIGTHALESASGTTTKPPMKLGANYVEVDAAGAVNGDKITFTLDGQAGTTWAVVVIRQPPTAAATFATVTDDDGDGTVVAVSESNDGLDKVVFAAVNLGDAGQAPDEGGGGGHTADLTTFDFNYEVYYSATGGDPSSEEKSAFGCRTTATPATAGSLFAGFLAAAAMLVIKRRRG